MWDRLNLPMLLFKERQPIQQKMFAMYGVPFVERISIGTPGNTN